MWSTAQICGGMPRPHYTAPRPVCKPPPGTPRGWFPAKPARTAPVLRGRSPTRRGRIYPARDTSLPPGTLRIATDTNPARRGRRPRPPRRRCPIPCLVMPANVPPPEPHTPPSKKAQPDPELFRIRLRLFARVFVGFTRPSQTLRPKTDRYAAVPPVKECSAPFQSFRVPVKVLSHLPP